MTAEDQSKIPVGSVLVDKYRITREIGRGGMAVVYEAENVDIGKRIAVKVLSAELVTSRIVRERFFREARAAAAVRSPYICDVYDVGEFDGRPFLVMELLEGESLYDRMTRVRRIDVATTLRIITQTAKGLAKAHAAGVVHRDLKPENLFLTRNEEGELVTKLLDFGLAKFYAPTDAADQVRLTREGALFGTPAYMSPEQAKGRGEVDHRSDLWALGCIAYECLTGHTVWNVDQGVAMILAQVATAPLPLPSKLRPDLPPAFDAWFEKALQRAAEDRFQSAAQFTISLTDALAPGDSGHIQTPSLLVDVDDVLQHVAQRRLPSSASVQTSVPAEFSTTGASAASAPSASHPGAAGSDPTSAGLESVGTIARKRNNRASVVLLLMVAVLGGSLYVYRTKLSLPFLSDRGGLDGKSTSESSPVGDVPLETGGFYDTVVKAQAALASGNYDEAVQLLDDAIKNGGEGIATNLRGHIRAALETPNSPCQLRAIGRPRPFNVSDPASRPSILASDKTAVVAWVDNYEDKAKRQVYTTVLDGAMRRVASVSRAAPESSNVRYPQLMQLGQRQALLYWDATAKDRGIFARFLDKYGRMSGGLKQMAPLTKDDYSPAFCRDEDDSLWLTWEADGVDGVQNLLLRHFDAQLNPLSEAVALTALRPDRSQRPSAVRPAIAIGGGILRVLFTLRQGASRRVHGLSIATKSPELRTGLNGVAPASLTEHRYIAPVQTLGREGTASDDSRIACLRDACLAFWGEDSAGIIAMATDTKSGEQLWRHEIGPRGARPAIGVNADELLVVWYEASRVRVATADRYGVGTVATVSKVSGLQPIPDVAPSNSPSQWLVAWRDFEAGHYEAATATIECHNNGPRTP